MTEPFNLPATPEENSVPPAALNRALQSVPAAQSGTARFLISVLDIQNFISPKLYHELTWDDDRDSEEVTQDCIDKALTLAEVLLAMVDEKLNAFSKTQQEVVKLLTVSKLYEYNGDKIGTKEFLQKAENLISDRYRSLEKKREDVSPVISVSKPKKKKEKFF
ncbi:hypothetical protein [Treponema pedis]|uniref:hypothetical protein n=1 Tax=Treponema pedis TaxID=409322 RepID=UPI003D239F5B